MSIRQDFLDLAEQGHRMPIATDLILHQQPDVESVLRNADSLARVIIQTAHRFRTPLAIPHMDLTLEKAILLESLGIPAEAAPTFHFNMDGEGRLPQDAAALLAANLPANRNPRFQAHVDSVRWVAEEGSCLPLGMAIGPFSLLTKLLADPITAIYAAGTGVTADEDPEVRVLEQLLELAVQTVLFSVREQLRRGAKVVFIAEPAANRVYISPRQIEQGSDVYDRFVMVNLRRVKALLREEGAELLLHCCGELTPDMVRAFGSLSPVMMSLGSSRCLCRDAAYVPRDVVLYGNLPSKRFYSDTLASCDEVARQAAELNESMKHVNHPFILGTECDVMSVPGCDRTIMAKIDAFMNPN